MAQSETQHVPDTYTEVMSAGDEPRENIAAEPAA